MFGASLDIPKTMISKKTKKKREGIYKQISSFRDDFGYCSDNEKKKKNGEEKSVQKQCNPVLDSPMYVVLHRIDQSC